MPILQRTPRAPLPPRAADRYDGACAVGAALDAVGGRWAPRVVGRLARGGARFSTLREAVGASPKSLAATLRRLVGAGVVERDADGPGVRYRLTAHGRDLVPVLDAFAAWAAAGDAGAASGVAADA